MMLEIDTNGLSAAEALQILPTPAGSRRNLPGRIYATNLDRRVPSS